MGIRTVKIADESGRSVADIPSWVSRSSSSHTTTVGEVLFQDIRKAIENGDLQLGQRLPSETALARFYGVSRPIVREALRTLQALGLTQTRSGSGTYVSATKPHSPSQFGDYPVRDLMEARPFIEAPAAAWAAIRRSQEQLDHLMRLCDAMDVELSDHAWVSLDSQFHVAVSEASGNSVFSQVIVNAREALQNQSHIVNTVAQRREDSNEEHRRIAEAIGRQDAEAARLAMRAHLLKVEGVMRPLME